MVRCQLVQDQICAEVEEEHYSKMIGVYQQGVWTRWECAEPCKITWTELWRAEPLHIKLLIQSVYDTLPGPANLHVRGRADTLFCQLCHQRGTLEHVLSCCPMALGKG